MEVWPCLHVKMLGNFGPQFFPSEDVTVADIVGLILTCFVGGQVNGCVTEEVHICHVIDSIPSKVTAWESA